MSIKQVIWDLSGTLFRPQNTGLTEQQIADYSFLFLMWSGKKRGSKLDDACFQVLYQLGEQTGPEEQLIRLHTGKPLPGILCSYLAGTIGSAEALEQTMSFLATWAPDHLSREEQHQVQRMLITFFDPRSLATVMKPIDVAVNLMHRTAQKSPLYVLSNWDADSFVPFYTKYATFILEPIEKNHMVISADTGYVKPQAGIYEYLLSRYHLIPDECLFIDDQEENVKAADELGIAAWHFQENHHIDLEQYLQQMYLV